VKLTSRSNVAVTYGPARLADIRQNFSAIEKIRRMLAWEPEVDLRRGLELTLNWLQGWPVSASRRSVSRKTKHAS